MSFELPSSRYLPILILFLALFVILAMIIMFNSFIDSQSNQLNYTEQQVQYQYS